MVGGRERRRRKRRGRRKPDRCRFFTLKAEKGQGRQGEKEDKGEKANFSVVLRVSTHLWIKNLHL
jgi:hypothetical protein